MSLPRILLPVEYRNAMFKSKATAGTFDITIVQPERLVVVTGWGYRSAAHGFVHTSGSSPLHDQHFAGKAEDANGFWYRVDPELHATWIFAARRDACLPMQVLHDSVEGWHQPGGEAMMTPIITIASRRRERAPGHRRLDNPE